MQKKLIALAVAGLASTAAFAQVTVYGVLDASLDSVKRSNSADIFDLDGATETASLNNNNFRVNRVSYNSSYFGFKGSEDLGAGTSAVFQLEAGVDPAAGAALSLSRDSFVGLSSQTVGTVLLGQLTGPTRGLGSAVDVNPGATGVGSNSGLIGKLANNLTNVTTDASGNVAPGARATSSTQASTFDTRFKNALAYVSPTIAGFNATLVYVANENKNLGGATAANVASVNGLNTSGTDIGVKYAAGPLMVAVTRNTVSVKNELAFSNGTAAAARAVTAAGTTLNSLGTNIKLTDTRVGGSYDLGVVKVSALYDKAKLKSDSTEADQVVYGVGAIVPVGTGRVLVQYYKANDVDVGGTKQTETGAKLYELGYAYPLSKRTELRAVYAKLDNDNGVNYDFGVNSMGNGASAATGAAGAITTVGLGSSVTGIQLGVRHTF